MKVGDKVKIRKDSNFYKDNWENNPRDVVGVITSLNGSGAAVDLPIDVKWPGIDPVNDYAEADLEVVK
jgi:hypothetical protein